MLSDTTLGGGTGLSSRTASRSGKEDLRGGVLVGPLLRACLDRGIEPATASRATTWSWTAAGLPESWSSRGRPVTSVQGMASSSRPAASNGIPIWCGFLRGPMTSPASVPTNTGDGLLMAMRAGAALGNMPQAWWAGHRDPGEISFGRPQRPARPGTNVAALIFVNRFGRRFTNEAANYNALGGALHQLTPPASTTSTCLAG